MKLLSTINLLISYLIFPLIMGFCNEPLLMGLSILYTTSATALISYGFNSKYNKGRSKGRTMAICANVTSFIAICVGVAEYFIGIEVISRVMTTACIVFIGGCFMLFNLYKNNPDVKKPSGLPNSQS